MTQKTCSISLGLERPPLCADSGVCVETPAQSTMPEITPSYSISLVFCDSVTLSLSGLNTSLWQVFEQPSTVVRK